MADKIDIQNSRFLYARPSLASLKDSLSLLLPMLLVMSGPVDFSSEALLYTLSFM